MSRWLLGTSACIAVALSPEGSAQGTAIAPTRLTRLPDYFVVDFVGTAARGVAMNDLGDIAGYSYLDIGCGSFCLPPLETVVWRGGDRIVLPSVPGFSGTYVRSINDKGWVAGLAGAPYTATRAVVWRPLGSAHEAIDLGTLPGTNASEAIGIDEQGRVIGWSTTTNWPPSGSPFLWTAAGGMVDLSAFGFPDEVPLAISPGGTVATADHWYRLDDPSSVTAMPPPPSGYGHGNHPTAVNDAGDQGLFLVRTSGQNLAYLYRYHHEGTWQQLSAVGTGHLSTYGIGSINRNRDMTATIQSRGVIAYGPSGLAEALDPLLSPAYPPLPPPDPTISRGGPMNDNGIILAEVMIGRSPRMVRLTPAWSCRSGCMRVDDLVIIATFVPDPKDPTRDHCGPEWSAYNEAFVAATVTDAAGLPLQGARLSGRFLDDYWTNERVSQTTDSSGTVIFSYRGPCGVGALTFLVDEVTKPGFVLDKTTGVLASWDIPQ